MPLPLAVDFCPKELLPLQKQKRGRSLGGGCLEQRLLKQNTEVTVQQKQETSIRQLILSRGHEFVTGSYKTVHPNVTIFCLKHKLITKTTYPNYKRTKFGCHCCAREKQSQIVSKANRLRKKTIRFSDF